MAADTYIAKTNFTAGEWSSELAGRVDLKQFANAVKVLKNWLVVPRGGVRVRPGTRFAARAKFNTGNTRITGFEFNVEQAYIVEIGNLYMRFYANNQRLERASKQIDNATNNGVGLIRITSIAHGFTNGIFVSIKNVQGTHEANGDWEVTNASADTFDLLGSTFTNTYTASGTDTASEIIELTTPYLAADIFKFKFVQSADVMYIFHPDYATRKLTRVGAVDFQLDLVDWKFGPFLPLNITATTITPSTATKGANGTLTASAALFEAGDVGSDWLIGTLTGGIQGYVTITGFTSSTLVDMTVQETLSGTSATLVWAEGAWSTVNGFPGAGMFYENRLVVGRTDLQPQTIWGSRTGQFENFDMSDVADDFAYSYDLVSKEANIINWLVGEDVLLIGTSGREHKATGGNQSGITPTNIFARPQSAHGSFDVEPVETTAGVVFIQRAGKKTRLMSFKFENDKYTAEDLNLLSNKITGSGLLELSYEAEPDELVWGIRADGLLISLTLLIDQNVIAWAQHVTDGLFKSVETIFAPTGKQTWAVVQRTIQAQTKKYIEFFDPTIALDSAILQSFAPPGVTTITSGLDHLEGKTVSIVGDSAVYPSQAVTKGALPAAFDPEIINIQVGLPFTPEIEFFQPDRELQDGNTTGRQLKVVTIALSVDNTIGLEVNGSVNYTRAASDLMDTGVKPETGIIIFGPDMDWNETVKIKQNLPFPAQVLAAFMFVNIGD